MARQQIALPFDITAAIAVARRDGATPRELVFTHEDADILAEAVGVTRTDLERRNPKICGLPVRVALCLSRSSLIADKDRGSVDVALMRRKPAK